MKLIYKCFAEALGAFAIVFLGCGAVSVAQIFPEAINHLGVAFAFGLVVMVMIYGAGHISGAHFNPAVTIAFTFTRHFPARQVIPYIASQIAGATFGAFLLKTSLTPILHLHIPEAVLNLAVTLPVDGLFLTALIWEFILTFMLMYVIMAVATDYRAEGSGAGLAIGGIIALEALVGGPICGASMNPARSIGPALISGDFQLLWCYIVAPVSGAVCAALFYQLFKCSTNEENQQIKGCC